MAYSFIGGKFRETDTTGLIPLAGGLLYTYAAGTLTPQATYTDAGGLSANTNPVVLDSAGRADVFLGTSAYRMILKSALGTTIWDEDNIPPQVFVTAVALALSSASSLIGFIHSFLGSVLRTVQDKLRDTFSFTDVGAVADNVTDSLTAVNLALSTPRAEIVVKEGIDIRVSALPTNSFGPRMGPGRVILPMTVPFAGRQQINSDTELQQQVWGQEYLYAAQVKLQARGGFTALFSGDSTTAGSSLVNAYSQIHSLVQAVVRDKGFDLTTVNGGHSGATAEQWRTTYLAADLATNPDLYVIRWGINDPGWNKSGTVGTSNAYEAEYANRRDITDYATTMRAALTTIRAAKTVAQMAIILMMPNSTADSPNGRDEKWYEQVRRVLRKCARDFQCTFIDTYAIWRDSRTAANKWMDDSFGDGRAIHPLDIMNGWIASVIGDLIVPSQMAIRNVGSAFAQPLISALPQAYPVGTSTFRATWTINAVVVNGMVVTSRGADGICLQRVVDYTVQRRVAERVGDAGSNTWQDWTSLPTSTTVLALSNAWTASGRGITYDKQGGIVSIRGRITGGTLTTGTVIATLPAGCWPVFDEYRVVPCGTGLATPAVILVSAATGQIQVSSVSSNALLDVGCSFSTF